MNNNIIGSLTVAGNINKSYTCSEDTSTFIHSGF